MTNYTYLLYGLQDEYYLEAAYSIGTLLRRIDARSARVIVFTDQPEKIKAWPVVCESISGQLAEMQGKTRFIHRAKLCVILRCLELYPGNVVYLDSDTFVRGDIQSLADKLAPRRVAIMDAFEAKNPIAELAGFQAKLSDQTAYGYTKDSWMLNSGVIGIHRQDAVLIRRALELCDLLLAAGMHRHTMEQFSLSEVFRLAPVKVLFSRGTIVHYVKAKYYMRQKISEVMRARKKQPWEFERPIPYWYPFVKFLKLIGQQP
jgi:hypothetical protein